MPIQTLITQNWGKPNSHTLKGYEGNGGYKALKKALKMKPEELVEEVKRSKLRGRGGAGFATGMKWGFLPKDGKKPVYLCVNADESEPGTFKDRYILENDPHMMIEGIAITCHAIGAKVAYIYIRGEFKTQAEILKKALAEAYDAGYLGKNICGSKVSVDVHVTRGAGAYICGEETALIESLEGKKGWPRLKPPFPAIVGLFGCPTIVNNVETLASVPHVISKGAEWYAGLGTEKSGGTRLICVSGHVNKPGVYEVLLKTTYRELIYDLCGGVTRNKKLKAVVPGGSSSPILAANEIDVAVEFDALAAIKTMAGSGGVIVFDDTTCMVRALWRVSRFYAEESCGQCTPCREGTPWMTRLCRKIEEGQGTAEDFATLKQVASNVCPYPPMGLGNTICPLGDAAALPVHSYTTKFEADFRAHIEQKRCPFESPWGALA